MTQAQFWLGEGTILGGRYRLDAVLGIGGFGITYRATDLRLERPAAVKEFYPSFWASRFTEVSPEVRVLRDCGEAFEKGLTRFRQEAVTLAQLNVSGVVQVSDFFPENNTAYLVMEYLDGKNLKKMAEGFGGRIPAEILLPAISPVIAALRQVHKKGLIHRDISPDNIMMLSDGSVRLIDFGNARDTASNKSMTLAMKEGFAPPEQYSSHGQGPYTDVYSLCATMYYCLTGKLPPLAMERLTGTPFYKPSELGVSVPAYQEQAIMDGLELYVKKRIQNMDELWQRLYVPVTEPVTEVTVDASADRQTVSQPEIPGTPPLDSFDQMILTGMSRIRGICAQIFRKVKGL